MAGYTEGQRLKGSDGNIYVVTNGVPVLAPQSITGPNPMKPLETRQKMIDVQKGQAELQKSPYELRKEAAEAKKAELDLKTAQEAYDAAHPKGLDSTIVGPDFLKTLPLPDREIVQALGEGRLAFPAGFALKAPWWQQKLEQVAQAYPGFDATNFNNRAKARATLLNGKVGASANALNTAIGHLGLLQSQISGTASHNFTPLNAIENFASQITGGSGITNFKDTAQKLAAELTTAYRNGGGAEADVVRQLQSLNPNASEKQKQDVIRNALELLASKQAANLYQYNLGAGGKPEVDLLDPAARAVLDQFPDIRDKYFSAPPPPLSDAAAALLTQNGGTPPPTPPASGSPPPNAPITPATGPTKTNFVQSATDKKVAAMLANGTPAAQIKKFVADNGGGYPRLDSVLAWRALHPTYKGGYDVSTQQIVPTTLANRVAASPVAAGLAGAADAGLAGFGDEIVGGINTLRNGGSLSDNIAAADFAKQALANANPGSTLAGNLVGGTAAAIGGGLGAKALLGAGAKGGASRNLLAWLLKNPVKGAAIGDTAYGSLYGAGENNDNRALGAGIGALVSPVASLAGSGAAKVLGGTVRGVVNPAVDRLQQAGIPLTAGEVLGGGFKKAQDAATSVFGPGNMIARRYNEGREALNRAAINEGGAPIGVSVNKVGQSGIDALDAAKSQAYANALDPISLNLNTPDFINPMRGVIEGAQAIPPGELPEGYAANTINRFVGGNISPDGTMSGRDFQKAYRGLAQTANRAAPKVEGHDISQALGQAKDILSGTLADQNPDAYSGFLKANTANRNLNVLANAVNAAKNQVSDGGEPLFTPAQLGTAATANAKKYSGNIAAASGNRPFNQLINDAQQVMSSKLPDSGTATRLAITAGLTGLGGGTGYGTGGSEGAVEGAAVPLAASTLLGTRLGQQLLVAALIKRQAALRNAGNYIMANPSYPASAVTAAAIPQLSGM